MDFKPQFNIQYDIILLIFQFQKVFDARLYVTD